MNPQSNSSMNFRQKQQGISLPVAMMMLIPLMTLALATANRNNIEEIMAGAQRDSQQAMMNADTGLALAGEQLYLLANGEITQNGLETVNRPRRSGRPAVWPTRRAPAPRG